MVEDRLISSFTNFARTGFESILRPDLILVFEKIDQKIIRLNYSKSIFFLLLDIYIYTYIYSPWTNYSFQFRFANINATREIKLSLFKASPVRNNGLRASRVTYYT